MAFVMTAVAAGMWHEQLCVASKGLMVSGITALLQLAINVTTMLLEHVLGLHGDNQ
jgi:hypothetical protein